MTTRAIELFKPRVIAMSGICAGMAGNSKLGTLVLADMCWEYQAGKWSDTGFKIEHYDVPLHSAIRTTLKLIASDPKGTRYKENLIEDPVVFDSSSLSLPCPPAGSGRKCGTMEDIGAQHRKAAALDMEMYGVYKAAELSSGNPLFGAKTVVDLADSAKGEHPSRVRLDPFGSLCVRCHIDSLQSGTLTSESREGLLRDPTYLHFGDAQVFRGPVQASTI